MKKLWRKNRIGILTADAGKLTDSILEIAGARPEKIVIAGMETMENFSRAVFDEAGWPDSDAMEKEAVQAAVELVNNNPAVSALLLECSMLSPYVKAIQENVGLPIFDYVTLIENS